ncbi:MAG: PrsW family intramembrane metalloprotease [Candidatus Methylacidiphilales bacterium]|nr:PrsW family intramembrane metalloprotease [Candidatus Methylacidiphilales bacterium]
MNTPPFPSSVPAYNSGGMPPLPSQRPPGSVPPRVPIRMNSPGNTLLIQIFAYSTAFLFMLGMGLLFLILVGVNMNLLHLLVGMILATLPVPAYITVLLLLDRLEPEPPIMMAMAFIWGATGAVLYSVIANDTMGAISQAIAGHGDVSNFLGLSVFAPINEEFSKAFILLVFFIWRRREYDGLLDGMIYGSFAGLGFAMSENFLYYGRAFGSGGVQSALFLLFLRGVFCAFSHPLFTSLTGMGFAIAANSKHILIKIIAPVVGLMMAMGLHAFWNFWGTNVIAKAAQSPWVGLTSIILIMFPGAVVMLSIAGYSLWCELKVIQTHLKRDLDSGFLTEREYKAAASLFTRIAFRFSAMKTSGAAGFYHAGNLLAYATELAFHRKRMVDGTASGNPELDRELEEGFLGGIIQAKTALGGRTT